jgi:hypothetical protein
VINCRNFSYRCIFYIIQDCVIEDGVFHDNLSTNSIALVLADIKNLPSQLTYVDNNLFIGMVPNMLIFMFIPKFNHICIAMITLGLGLGVINYRNFSYRCIFYIWMISTVFSYRCIFYIIWMIMSTVFINTKWCSS